MYKTNYFFKSIFVASLIFGLSFTLANQSNGGITIAEGLRDGKKVFQVNEPISAEENGFVVVNVNISDSVTGTVNVSGIVRVKEEDNRGNEVVVSESVRSSASVWSFVTNIAGVRPPSDLNADDSFTMPVVAGEEWEVTVDASTDEFNVNIEFISFPEPTPRRGQ